jgi:hypothetical protein
LKLGIWLRMEFFWHIVSAPWTLAGILSPAITFILGLQIQKRLTRYREHVSHLHRDLGHVREICKQACLDAAKLKPCLYDKSEPSDELLEIIEYPPVRDKKLLNNLKEFLNHVNEQRNIFSWGSGSADIAVEHSSGKRVYYEIFREGNDAVPLPNLTDDRREQLLRTKANQLREAFDSVDRRIEKLLR